MKLPKIRTPLLLAAALAALALSTPGLAAQTALTEGARVRVRTESEGRLQGSVLSLGADSLVLSNAGGVRTVPFSQVRRVEVGRPRGRGEAMLSNGWKGLLGGAATGLVLGVIANETDECGDDCLFILSDGEVVGIFTVFFGGVGAVSGGLLGLIHPGTKWERVRPDVGLSIAPGREGGVALGATIRF